MQATMSRAGLKLKNAFEDFSLTSSNAKNSETASICHPRHKICIDIGASHGGFSNILLQEGAKHIYSIDVAYGIFDYALRKHPDVTVLEQHDFRNLELSWIADEHIEFLKQHINEQNSKNISLFFCADVSFISSKNILFVLSSFYKKHGFPFVAYVLIKPQFEASEQTNKGIMNDPHIRSEILADMKSYNSILGLYTIAAFPAMPKGRRGNQEYMLVISSEEF